MLKIGIIILLFCYILCRQARSEKSLQKAGEQQQLLKLYGTIVYIEHKHYACAFCVQKYGELVQHKHKR